MIILLHNIRSLFNTGSIFRTADGAGVEKIYLCGITPSPYDNKGNPRAKFVKVSLGAEQYVPWERAVSTSRMITKLKKQGFIILVAEVDKRAVPYVKVKLTKQQLKKTALVLGHEVMGLPKSILKKADKIVMVPMRGKKECLNVSVAFGVLTYGLLK
ncbi:MAG: TrmH family RNA methyltransferase [bacterium]